jgi:hypothetical protein
VLHAPGFGKLCSSSGIAKRPHFTLLRSHHETDGFATLAKAFESLRHLPLRTLDVHIIKISSNPDLRKIPQVQSKYVNVIGDYAVPGVGLQPQHLTSGGIYMPLLLSEVFENPEDRP